MGLSHHPSKMQNAAAMGKAVVANAGEAKFAAAYCHKRYK
jgi:hypothetical protein